MDTGNAILVGLLVGGGLVFLHAQSSGGGIGPGGQGVPAGDGRSHYNDDLAPAGRRAGTQLVSGNIGGAAGTVWDTLSKGDRARVAGRAIWTGVKSAVDPRTPLHIVESWL